MKDLIVANIPSAHEESCCKVSIHNLLINANIRCWETCFLLLVIITSIQFKAVKILSLSTPRDMFIISKNRLFQLFDHISEEGFARKASHRRHKLRPAPSLNGLNPCYIIMPQIKAHLNTEQWEKMKAKRTCDTYINWDGTDSCISWCRTAADLYLENSLGHSG